MKYALVLQCLALFLILFDKIKGIRSSGVLFLFWLLLAVCEAIPFRTAIQNSYPVTWVSRDSEDKSMKIIIMHLLQHRTLILVRCWQISSDWFSILWFYVNCSWAVGLTLLQPILRTLYSQMFVYFLENDGNSFKEFGILMENFSNSSETVSRARGFNSFSSHLLLVRGTSLDRLPKALGKFRFMGSERRR